MVSDGMTDREYLIRKLEIEERASARKDRNQLIISIFTAIMQLITPAFMFYQTEIIKREVGDVRSESEVAAIKAQEAVQVVQKSSKVRDEKLSQLDEKIGATNLQWKAYNEKTEESRARAEEALAKVESMEPIPPAKAIP